MTEAASTWVTGWLKYLKTLYWDCRDWNLGAHRLAAAQRPAAGPWLHTGCGGRGWRPSRAPSPPPAPAAPAFARHHTPWLSMCACNWRGKAAFGHCEYQRWSSKPLEHAGHQPHLAVAQTRAARGGRQAQRRQTRRARAAGRSHRTRAAAGRNPRRVPVHQPQHCGGSRDTL